MNLGPGGKQPIMRSTTFVDINGQQKIQQMIFDENHLDFTMRGQSKGIRRILMERDLWREG
ncbi:10290_t:CDS:1, partial [Ambispora gerdemannii]